MSIFTVNGKEYKAKAFDFNLVCDLEDMGVPLEEIGKKPMSLVRAYFGLCAGKGREFAGKEIEDHIIGGGTFDDIMTAMSDEMEKSDFFRNLNEKAKTKATADEGEAEEKK